MADIRAQRMDPKIGSTLGYLGTGLLKAVEVSDLARRVEALEKIGAQATSNDIIAGLVRLANMHPATTRGGISGQVSALMGLAKIRGMLNEVDLDDFFRGWTDDELEAYAKNGVIPPRFRSEESPSPGPAGPESRA